MGEPAGRIVIVANGRVLEVPASHLASVGRLEASVAWWESLAILGGSLLILGALVGAGLGSPTAICGFTLFLATAVLGGAERYEFATALGVSAIVWTSAGISVYLGTDPSLVGSLLGFEVVGAAALVGGILGTLRRRSRDDRSCGLEP